MYNQFVVSYLFSVLVSDIFALSRCLFSISAVAFLVFDITFIVSAVFDFVQFKIVVCSWEKVHWQSRLVYISIVFESRLYLAVLLLLTLCHCMWHLNHHLVLKWTQFIYLFIFAELESFVWNHHPWKTFFQHAVHIIVVIACFGKLWSFKFAQFSHH